MCAINGIFAFAKGAGAPARGELLATREAMVARGPDGAGEYWSEDRLMGFGHRRLSIIDLSERANQPMISACGRYAIVFNGEIYNYQALRRTLEGEGLQFRTTSDTEVLLHLFARDREAMCGQLRGMFAFALWDNQQRTLFLARDPHGIKPLYVAESGGTFRFASQVKAILAGGGVSRNPEPAGLVGFYLWGSVPEPFTLYRSIRALPAGHAQWVDASGPRPAKPFANIAAVFADGADAPHPADEIEARVRAAMHNSVAAHLLADVEVGVFLSGGIDSCALLGLMRDAGQEKIRAITLSFEEFRGTSDDETVLAAEVARLYGAAHIVRSVSAAEFEQDLPAILEAMDQPSIDGVNSWFVSKAAKEAGLKVALSGLGGDELLAGYPSFSDIPKWVAAMHFPSAIPGLGWAARKFLRALGVDKSNPKALGMFDLGGTYPGAYLLRRGLMLPKELDGVLDAETVAVGLKALDPLKLVQAAITPEPSHPLAKVAAMESGQYMRNQLLRDADWSGMAHSLEIRTPLVDFQLLQALAPSIPHFGAKAGKHALAMAPSHPLPDSVKHRSKTGFSVPLGRWTQADNKPNTTPRRLESRAFAKTVIAHPSFERAAPPVLDTRSVASE
jgi:asparagine synthase (glutamine-hydrolysing)